MHFRKLLMVGTILAIPTIAVAQPVTGLYVGAGVGANFLQNEVIKGVTLPGDGTVLRHTNPKFDAGAVGVGSVGWGFGNGFRVELEGNDRWNQGRSIGQYGQITSGSEQKYGAMVNGLYDFDLTPYGISFMTPYLGAGVGYVHDELNGIGAVSQGAAVPTQVRINNGTDTFAYQGIVGAAFPVASIMPGLSLTAEYRFYDVPQDQKFATQYFAPNVTSGPKTKTANDLNHSVMIGLRYAFNAAPPPPPPPAAAPAPAAAPSRSYLVFFDWDRSDLSARARQIIAEAAQNSHQVQTTRIEVDGNADRTGTEAYNMALSRRRADVVAGELVRDGVSRDIISIQAFGDTRPLVPTAAGVREPQNRRVEIILH